MTTIKTIKKMTIPQLIEWGFENDFRHKSFITNESNRDKQTEVHFNAAGIPQFSSYADKDDIFTVEIGKEITENTKIWKFIELSSEGLLGRTYLHKNLAIEDVKTDNSVAFYIIDEDLTPTLIWKKGKLVD